MVQYTRLTLQRKPGSKGGRAGPSTSLGTTTNRVARDDNGANDPGYPQAGTRSDASALLIQLKGQLAQRGDPSAKRDVTRAATGSDRGCADMEMQIAALDALQQMDSERVMPLLRKVLARREACSTPLRKNALFILAQKSGSDRETLLLSVAKGDPSADVRSDAVFHLSQAKSDAAVDAVADLLLHADERGVRQNALFALAQNRSDRARSIVKTFALSNDAPLALRTDAVFHRAQDPAFLMEAYAKVTDPELRGNILFHIASRPGPETNKWLVSVIVDPKETMEQRKNALFHLASRKTEGGDELSAVYDRVPVALKKDIIFHLAQRGGLDKLIAIARTDPNQELRKDALFHIGQSKDPRALKALEEIVNHEDHTVVPGGARNLLFTMVAMAVMAQSASAQTLERRIANAKGTVAFEYTTRRAVCGNGSSIEISDDTSAGWTTRSRRSGWIRLCVRSFLRLSPGPFDPAVSVSFRGFIQTAVRCATNSATRSTIVNRG